MSSSFFQSAAFASVFGRRSSVTESDGRSTRSISFDEIILPSVSTRRSCVDSIDLPSGTQQIRISSDQPDADLPSYVIENDLTLAGPTPALRTTSSISG